jgi:ribosomal protein L11 methyltransferase
MRELGTTIWQVTLRLPARRDDGPTSQAQVAQAYAEWAERETLGVSAFEEPGGGWTISAFHRARPDAARIRAETALIAAATGTTEPVLEIAATPPSDWLALAYAGFPARRIGRFYVHGSHLPAPAGGLIGLRIDAATAFGSGEHATTEGCLRAIDALGRGRPRLARALDMGAGSGILAIAVAKQWKTARVVAIDIDVESARVAAANARLNQVGARVRAVQGNGYRAPLAARGAKFDLIVANILARPLARMAPALARRLAPGGIAILSGLLRRQERQVFAAHSMVGLRRVARHPIGEWQTLVLRG